MAAGGVRQPAQPAATSGPGALSQRTDGGPGSSKQPIRVPTGGAYGEAQALRQQQEGAPLSAGGVPTATPGTPPAPSEPDLGVFGPTELPNQPITTGVSTPAGGPPPDPDLVLRQLVKAFPSPWMMRLLRRR